MKTDEAHDAVLEIVQMLLRQIPGYTRPNSKS